MKVAMIVHNTVLNDARVTKEAVSLSNAGHNVKLFGYGIAGLADRFVGDVEIVLTPPIKVHAFATRLDAFLKSWGQISRYIFARGKRGLFDIFLALYIVFEVVSYTSGAILHSGSIKISHLIPFFALCIAVDHFVLRRGISYNFFTLFRRARINFYKNLQNRLAGPARHKQVAMAIAGKVDIAKFDVVHAHDLIAAIAAMELKKIKPEIRVVWDAHELYPELRYKTQTMNRFARDVIERMSLVADRFITINDSIGNYYAENFPQLPPALILKNATRRGPSNSLVTKDESPLRRATNINPDQLILLFQGGLSHSRGIDILLQAAPQIPEEWSIVFMGDGPMRTLIEDTISSLPDDRPNDRPRVVRIPAVPHEELREWTSGADLGVIPYLNNGLNHFFCTPNKLWEYPNAGVPILATNLPEMRIFIKDHEIGWLVPEKPKPSDFVGALKGISRDSLRPFVQSCLKFNDSENWEQKYEPKLVSLYAGLRK